MKISTKGRYAIRVMIDLAQHNTGDYIPLMDIAQRQEISEKYLEAIVGSLSRKGLVMALRGKGGGYKLAKEPSEYNVLSILECTETSMSPVACLENPLMPCERATSCMTVKMWKDLDTLVRDYFSKITIEDLINSTASGKDNYVI